MHTGKTDRHRTTYEQPRIPEVLLCHKLASQAASIIPTTIMMLGSIVNRTQFNLSFYRLHTNQSESESTRSIHSLCVMFSPGAWTSLTGFTARRLNVSLEPGDARRSITSLLLTGDGLSWIESPGGDTARFLSGEMRSICCWEEWVPSMPLHSSKSLDGFARGVSH